MGNSQTQPLAMNKAQKARMDLTKQRKPFKYITLTGSKWYYPLYEYYEIPNADEVTLIKLRKKLLACKSIQEFRIDLYEEDNVIGLFHIMILPNFYSSKSCESKIRSISKDLGYEISLYYRDTDTCRNWNRKHGQDQTLYDHDMHISIDETERKERNKRRSDEIEEMHRRNAAKWETIEVEGAPTTTTNTTN